MIRLTKRFYLLLSDVTLLTGIRKRMKAIGGFQNLPSMIDSPWLKDEEYDDNKSPESHGYTCDMVMP